MVATRDDAQTFHGAFGTCVLSAQIAVGQATQMRMVVPAAHSSGPATLGLAGVCTLSRSVRRGFSRGRPVSNSHEDHVTDVHVDTASLHDDDGEAAVEHHAALQLTFLSSPPVPAAGTFAAWGAHDVSHALNSLGLPAGEIGTLDSPLVARDDTVRILPLLPTVRRLASMPAPSNWPAWNRPSDALLSWSVAAKLALEVVTSGRILPALRATPMPDAGMAYWRALAPRDGRVSTLAASFPPAAFVRLTDSGLVAAADDVLLAFLDAVADACGRQGHRPALATRRGISKRPWDELWPEALVAADPTVTPLRLPSEEVEQELDEWVAPALGRRSRGITRLAMRLIPPVTGDDGNDSSTSRLAAVDLPWELELLLQSTLDRSATIPVAKVWEGGVLELADRRVDDAEDAVIRGLSEAARVFSPIDRALSEQRPTMIQLRPNEASALLADKVDELADAGVGVLLPPELRQVNQQRLRARIRIGQSTSTAGRVEQEGQLRQSDLTSFRYEIAIGDDTLSEAEFAEIVALKRTLVRWRGQWVRIDVDESDRIAELAGQTGTMAFTEALAAALAGYQEGGEDDEEGFEVIAHGDLLDLIDRLREAGRPEHADIVGIEGDLRNYQERGVAWLQQLSMMGAGGVLADQMGLGKTIQAIALLTSRQQDRPHLVVAPTSVVGNWEREINRFAPGLVVSRHHGPDRIANAKAFKPGLVVLTSYALLRRDAGLLEQVDWDIVVFDEAQQIKNAASKGAKVARNLEARSVFAMTGTPIENRLAELWSIVDVTNPGLLGTQRRFNQRYAVPIERWRDDEAASRLRRLIAPFVLRRRKDDPDVAVDLPPKTEVTVDCTLTREQATLYQAAIDRAFSTGLGATAFERRGRILALLTALKQICNHPAHHLKDGGRLVGRSGKLLRATEILGEVVAANDHALIFTQYRVMGDLLVEHLMTELDLPEVPFLHGGTPMHKRDEMVDRFQEAEDAPPLMLVSLRAGGTGLNLTRATQVMHFDRWWNPAVEDQATDRVHRIGQTRPVTIHRMVTVGTVEERIADLLERKRSLADAVVGEGETWITELDDNELRELVALSANDFDDDEDQS